MWYADALSYKLRGYAITGLVYKALPMGAVPVGHESIIDLKDVPCEEIEINETNAYHFVLKSAIDFPTLSADDQQILDKVIQRFGMMKKEDLVEFMHQEKAYKKLICGMLFHSNMRRIYKYNIASTLNAKPRFGASSIKTHAGSGVFLFFVFLILQHIRWQHVTCHCCVDLLQFRTLLSDLP